MNVQKPWPCLTLGDPRQPPLVFLHGFLGRGAEWETVAARFADAYHCFLPDLPGHGANTDLAPDVPLHYDSLADGLHRTLAQPGARPVILTGYSLGGRVALYFSLRYPELVRALILESTSPGISDESSRQERASADACRADAIYSGGLAVFVDEWYNLSLFRSLHHQPALLERIKQSRQNNQPAWMAKIIRELSPGRQPYLGERLRELTMPTLLLAGSLDEKYAAALRGTAARISRARTLIIRQAGHTIHVERPARFIRVLRAFLNTLP